MAEAEKGEKGCKGGSEGGKESREGGGQLERVGEAA